MILNNFESDLTDDELLKKISHMPFKHIAEALLFNASELKINVSKELENFFTEHEKISKKWYTQISDNDYNRVIDEILEIYQNKKIRIRTDININSSVIQKFERYKQAGIASYYNKPNVIKNKK